MVNSCDPVDSLAVNQAEDIQAGHTAFVSEAAECAVIPSISEPFQVQPTDDNQSIKDFLSRPIPISRGTLSASPGIVVGIPVGNSFLSLLGDNVIPRLRGIAGIRATIKFHVVVAATPFHQGVLNLSFQYGTGTLTGSSTNNVRGSNYPLTVNLPHVLLDLAESTMATLEVPYISSFEYLPLSVSGVASLDWPMGIFCLNKLTTVRLIAGQNAPGYTVYVSLHDIELIGIRPVETATAILQSGVPTTKQNVVSGSSGRQVPVSNSGLTAEKKKHGLYSGFVGKAADLVHYVSYIPSLSSVGGTAEWFLRSTSKALAAFGYSKPHDETKISRMLKTLYGGESQVDYPNEAFVASPFQSNTLAVTAHMGGDDEDHMAFDYVLTKPSYIFRGELTTIQSADTLLYATNVSPLSFWYRDIDSSPLATGNIPMPLDGGTTTNAFLPSTLMYVSSNFGQWRGDLKFTIKFGKTKMHGGRLLLTYTPAYSVTNPSVPVSTVVDIPATATQGINPQGFATIVDLKDGSLFEFIVPYTSPAPYTAVNGSIGSFSMHVINPLVAPAVASDTVDFMVWVSAMPGFELACLRPSMLDGVGSTGTLAILQDGVGGVSNHNDSSQLVVGEKFNSVKQLIMSPDFAAIDVANAASVEYVFTPWFKWNNIGMTVPLPAGQTRLWYGAKSSRIARMYAYCNGATASSVFVDGAANNNVTITVSQTGNDAGSAPAGFGNLYNKGNNFYSALVMPEPLNFFKAIIPTYSRYARLPHNLLVENSFVGGAQDLPTTSPGPYSAAFSDMQTTFRIRNNSGGSRRILYSRAAADDARLAQFIGPPPCILWPSNKSVTPSSGNSLVW